MLHLTFAEIDNADPMYYLIYNGETIRENKSFVYNFIIVCEHGEQPLPFGAKQRTIDRNLIAVGLLSNPQLTNKCFEVPIRESDAIPASRIVNDCATSHFYEPYGLSEHFEYYCRQALDYMYQYIAGQLLVNAHELGAIHQIYLKSVNTEIDGETVEVSVNNFVLNQEFFKNPKFVQVGRQ